MATQKSPPKTTNSTPQSKTNSKRKSQSTHNSPQDNTSPSSKVQTKLNASLVKSGKATRKPVSKTLKSPPTSRTSTTGTTLQVKQEKLSEADKSTIYDSEGEDIYSDVKYDDPIKKTLPSSPSPHNATQEKEIVAKATDPETETESKSPMNEEKLSAVPVIPTDKSPMDISPPVTQETSSVDEKNNSQSRKFQRLTRTWNLNLKVNRKQLPQKINDN